MNDTRAFLLPLTDFFMEVGEEGRTNFTIETVGGKMAATLTPLDAARMAVHLLYWASKNPDAEDLTIEGSPMLADGLGFEAAESRDQSRVGLWIDVGPATLRFEVQNDQLLAALGQPTPGEGG